MEPTSGIVVSLNEAHNRTLHDIGSKARNLSLLIQQGFKVPDGFSITTSAYDQFIKDNQLFNIIDMEVFRKPPDDMRWEEIWDASLRIRSAFLKASMPENIEKQIISAFKELKISTKQENPKFSVRSSSPAEDSSENSFAGIHESYINIESVEKILESVKLVWASLWSDRAILYRNELRLDSIHSSISVLIQIMEEQPISGLAFSQDPSGNSAGIVIEAIYGLCSELVDNEKIPEKWVLNKDNGDIVNHNLPDEYNNPILNKYQLKHLFKTILSLENYFHFPVDVEWTGVGSDLTLLQTRPITSFNDDDQDRQWYLTLTPSFKNLKKLADKVENELIPQLQQDGIRLAGDNPADFNKVELADKIKERAETYLKWKEIYWDDFIPFAHGIRNFGTFYNDLVKPEDAYEFLEILKTDDLLASQRNKELFSLADYLKDNNELKNQIELLLREKVKGNEFLVKLSEIKSSNKNISPLSFNKFCSGFKSILDNHLDIAYENQSLKDHPELIMHNIINLTGKKDKSSFNQNNSSQILKKLYDAAGVSRQEEVDEVLRIARLSWKLRDDDNILLGKVENQLLKFINFGKNILIQENRLTSEIELSLEDWEVIYNYLRGDEKESVIFNPKNKIEEKVKIDFKPRQLIGQPSSPGMVTGRARIINSFDDFSSLKSGEILVCDAIQPQMTFLVSLAAGIIERRGGMLVHSSIIAREMGIPAVNGVSNATQIIKTGDIVTVNGYLGLVIIGEAEFDLELQSSIELS